MKTVMSQKEIARRAKCSVGMVSLVLRGLRRPSAEMAQRLERATGVPRAAWLWPAKYPNPLMRPAQNRPGKESP